jgi:CRISPR/Cas system-associated exonuclease Cas4 (RecB family)
MKFTKDGRLIMSDSMMKTYQDCGARFWFTYLENPEELIRIPAFEFGSVLHSMFYEFFKRKRPDSKMYTSPKNFANVFRGKWFSIDSQPKTDRGKRKPEMIWRSPDEKEKLLGAGYKICQEFYERNESVPFSHVLVEQYFMVTLTNEKTGKGYALQGYIDRIEVKGGSHPSSFKPEDLGQAIKSGKDGTLWVIDYKSGYKPTAEAALNLDTQFSCYDLAVEILFPFRERKFAIENVRDGSYTPTSRGEGERRVLRERIFTIGKAIEKEKFPMASNMYKCGSCSYLKHCNSLQKFAHQKGIHPEDLMRASSPIPKRGSKIRSMFEWKNGEIVRVTDERRLHYAEKLRTRPVQLSFFIDEEELAEVEEEITAGAGKPFAQDIVEKAIAWEASAAVIDSME